ncbi:MAG: site-2 protease family protein [Terracidiphilus sp.]
MESNAILVGVFEFVILLLSLTVHECAHAWTASRLGDQTARMMGRISLNPMDHIDPIGTLLIPGIAIFGPLIGLGFLGGFIFGWAKPVPIISRNFKNYRRDDILVSMAGPVSNLLLAVVAFFGLAAVLFTETHLPEGADPSVAQQAFGMLCNIGLQLNLVLCIFNLIPVPPLDGSHVMRQFLPYNAVQVYDRITGIASYILLILVARFVLGAVMHPVLGLAYSLLAHI